MPSMTLTKRLNGSRGDCRVTEAKKVLDDNNAPERSVTQSTVIVWKNIVLFILLHSSLFYSLYALIVFRPWNTLMFCKSKRNQQTTHTHTPITIAATTNAC